MRNIKKVTPETLSRAVEFDCAFEVLYGDRICEPRDVLYAPDVLDGVLESDAWEFVDGFSGQDSYSGPIMHESEYLGGGMARFVLDNPGVYVMTPAYYSPEEEGGDFVIEGWALLKHK
ncbi:MAG: hypothetical protein ACYDB1_09575 [Acidiferrobacteraceae bacterium]